MSTRVTPRFGCKLKSLTNKPEVMMARKNTYTRENLDTNQTHTAKTLDNGIIHHYSSTTV